MRPPLFPKPSPQLFPNTYAYESQPMVKPTGFREYDARWLFEKEINLMGVQALGLGLARLLKELGVPRDVVVGHDFRSYSASIKLALTAGLMAGGAKVRDIGLAITPMAYFAQFALDAPAVAMVTASHNDNGWTGVKMGAARPVTFGPEEMGRLRDIVIGGDYAPEPGGAYEFVPDFPGPLHRRPDQPAEVHAQDEGRRRLRQRHGGRLRAGTARRARRRGRPARLRPRLHLSALQPEPRRPAHAARDGGGGEGDRRRRRARLRRRRRPLRRRRQRGPGDLRRQDRRHAGARPVEAAPETRPSSSTSNRPGLFATDPALAANGVKVDFWKTGHSHIKRRVRDLKALAGFEKSGHFFFNAPVGRGYDDGFVTAIAVLDMLDRNPGKSMADLYRDLPKTWGSPTMSPHCADEVKYAVADRVTARFKAMQAKGETLTGQTIRDIVTVNGVRVTVEDGTWGLVRASSNKPELVVVVESPVSEARMREMFKAVDGVLRENPEVGAYNQTI